MNLAARTSILLVALLCSAVLSAPAGAAVTTSTILLPIPTTTTTTSTTTLPPECVEHADCSDGLFCNGEELCNGNQCIPGSLPCRNDCQFLTIGLDAAAAEIVCPALGIGMDIVCDEEIDSCIAPECETDEHCSDELYCNGMERCIDGRCREGVNPCEIDPCRDNLTVGSDANAAGLRPCTEIIIGGDLVCDEETDMCVARAECEDVLDFEDFGMGEVVSETFGVNGIGPIGVKGTNLTQFPASTNAAAIYDSSCPGGCSSGLTNLGTPNEDFAGPGEGTGGEVGMPGENNDAQNNVLIVARNLHGLAENGFITNPRPQGNNKTVTIDLDFSAVGPVSLFGFHVIDGEEDEDLPTVELFDETDTSIVVFAQPVAGGPNSDMAFALPPNSGVLRARISLFGSAAIDDVHFALEDCAPPICMTDDDCDDGLFCNGQERCGGVDMKFGDGAGIIVDDLCIPGMAPCEGACDESTDMCVEPECETNLDCSDGLFCTGTEICDNGTCAPGDEPCGGDTPLCFEDGQFCGNCNIDADCDDGLFCNGMETCGEDLWATPMYFGDPAGLMVPNHQCNPGMPPCADGESCNEAGDVCLAPDCEVDEDCSDDLFCNGDETCNAGTCEPGTPPCPVLCAEFADKPFCTECADSSDCDDGIFCNGPEICLPVELQTIGTDTRANGEVSVPAECVSTNSPCKDPDICIEDTMECVNAGCMDVITFDGFDEGATVMTVFGSLGNGPIDVHGTNLVKFPASTNAAAIVDSSCSDGTCAASQESIGTPNEDFGGPGEGAGGASGAPGENSASLGNILIVTRMMTDTNPADGLIDNPRAQGNDKTTMADFDFAAIAPVTIKSVDFIDVDEDELLPSVTLYDMGGSEILTATLAEGLGGNSVDTLVLPVNAGAYSMRITLRGSAAVDNVAFAINDCVDGTTTTTSTTTSTTSTTTTSTSTTTTTMAPPTTSTTMAPPTTSTTTTTTSTTTTTIPLVSVFAFKYDDVNRNGVRDAGTEPYLVDWEFSLYDSGGAFVSSGLTGNTGATDNRALVGEAPAGDYTVCETPQDGWMNSDPGPGTNDPLAMGRPCIDVTLVAGLRNVFFGNHVIPTTTTSTSTSTTTSMPPPTTSTTMPLSPCDPNPCLNGGICLDPSENLRANMMFGADADLPGEFSCVCFNEFSGEFCEIPPPTTTTTTTTTTSTTTSTLD